LERGNLIWDTPNIGALADAQVTHGKTTERGRTRPLLVTAMLSVGTTVGSRRMGPLLVTAMLSVGALAMPRALDIGVVAAPLLGGGVLGRTAAIAVTLAIRRVNRTDKAD